MEPAVALFIFNPSTQKAGAVDLWVQDQAGLHSEFQTSQNHTVRTYFKERETEEPEEDA